MLHLYIIPLELQVKCRSKGGSIIVRVIIFARFMTKVRVRDGGD